MESIRVLAPDVVSKIAAGEVVERPASVVKELVENSLDAGARQITVELEDGGRELIRVVDDGRGISRDQLPLALEEHATSKLGNAEDLFAIRTFGFRGEALNSIAGVSELTIISRPANEPIGAKIESHHGTVLPVRDIGCPVGTQIEVRHLFDSVPVRRKFLKSKSTELGHITEVVTRLALAWPGVGIEIKHHERKIFERSRGIELSASIRELFGKEIADSLIPIDGKIGTTGVHGYVASPSVDRPNSQMQYLFVNGRFIRDRSLSHALTEAYRGLLMTGRYPIGFLFFDVPPDEVDVNVHPTKIEVRFVDPSRLYSLLLSSIRTKFLSQDLSAKLSAKPWQKPAVGAEGQVISSVPAGEQRTNFAVPNGRSRIADEFRLIAPPMDSSQPSLFSSEPSLGKLLADPPIFLVSDDSPNATPPVPASSRLADRSEPAVKPTSPVELPKIMQIHQSYLVVETEDGMLIVDQHALHERILFEEFSSRVASQQVEVQERLVPEPVEMTPAEYGRLLEHSAILAELGFWIDEYRSPTLLVRGIPAVLRKIKLADVLRGLAERLESAGKNVLREHLLAELLEMLACKAAVKAGDPLTSAEMAALLERRHLVDDSHHCPHGRPTLLKFTLRDLEKQFKRV